MSTLQRMTLGFLALCLVAIWAYGIAYVAYDLLEQVSAEWVWAGGMAILLTLYIAFAKRALKDIKGLKLKAESEEWRVGTKHEDTLTTWGDRRALRVSLAAKLKALVPARTKWYQGDNGKQLKAMSKLERDTQGWKQSGAGSVGASAVGLDAIDEAFDL